jgi:hypothetical protein
MSDTRNGLTRRKQRQDYAGTSLEEYEKQLSLHLAEVDENTLRLRFSREARKKNEYRIDG